MLKNENIICISLVEWDFIPLVMHHMMTRLAKSNRVLFVDPPIAFSNLLIRPSLWKKQWLKTLLWLRGVCQITEKLYVYYPPPLLLQYGHLKVVDGLNQVFTAYALSKVAKRLEFLSPILWIYHPYVIDPKGQVNEKLICYDCNDDLSFLFSQHFDKRKRLSKIEANLTRKADVVFTTSKHLFRLRELQNPNTYYLPSAIDFELFNKSISPDFKAAPEIEAIPGPIIGFIGGMHNSKMNWQWIKKAAQAHLEWNFVFVGPCFEPPPSDITEQKNIIFLGAKPSEALPSYIKGFDVCLIPYQGEEFLKACQPTKAFEYLAAGKPVVASWISEFEDYQKIIRLSRETKDFIENIEEALMDGKNEEMIRLYVRTAMGYTWDDRIEKASGFINDAIRRRRMAG
jgi:glycosyltransferase involved in cell wall biosynthesis